MVSSKAARLSGPGLERGSSCLHHRRVAEKASTPQAVTDPAQVICQVTVKINVLFTPELCLKMSAGA